MQPSDNPITEEFLRQYPAYALVIVFVTGLALTGLFGSLLSWIFLFVRRSQGKAILPIRLPWQPRQWALVEVLGIVISALFLNSILALLLAQALKIERGEGVPLELAAAGGVGSLISVIAGTIWICARYRVSLPHVGFDKPSFRLLGIGLIAGLVSLPGMYILMMIVSAISKSKYEHPLIDSAVESATLFGYLMAVFAAAIVAPIAEEFFFRVVLQGWMQSIPFKNIFDNLIGRLGLATSQLPNLQPVVVGTSDSALFDSPGSVVEANYQPGFATSNHPDTLSGLQNSNSSIASIYEPSKEVVAAQMVDSNINDTAIMPPLWPCIVCGLLFGFAHFDYGMSFIPLSFLGIFLGWLYRQTHSIWPCIIVHMMLNSFSMIMLGLVIMLKQAGVEVGK
ncbi:MAG: CPBP family intramembrane glutamic endopeptidase [Pirellulales bacterium]